MGRAETRAGVEGQLSGGGTQGKGEGQLAAGRNLQELQSAQVPQGAQGLRGGQGQTSGEPGLEYAGKYYLAPAVIERLSQDRSSSPECEDLHSQGWRGEHW